MEKIINLTPHCINVYYGEKHIKDIPVSGLPVPRCHQQQVVVGYVDKIEITRQIFGDVENLPEPVDETYYVVSRMVAEAAPNRYDLLVPGPLVRNADGQPCGCQGLAVIEKLAVKEKQAMFGSYKPNESYIANATGNETHIFCFGNGFGASVVRGEYTYGGPQGLWEVAILRDGEQCYDTKIAPDVVGWLDENEVAEMLGRIERLGEGKTK